MPGLSLVFLFVRELGMCLHKAAFRPWKPINLLLYSTVDTDWQLLIISGEPVVIQGDAVKTVV